MRCEDDHEASKLTESAFTGEVQRLREVNYELLSAAKYALSFIEGAKKIWPDEIDLQLRRAIAKAEKRP